MGCKKLTYRRETPILKVAYRSAKTRANTCTGTYKYGFNGKEKIDEVYGKPGSFYDYDNRMYNSLIGRPLSLDPIARQFPELSPYQFFSNNPIWFIDLDGLEGIPTEEKPDGGYTTALDASFIQSQPIKQTGSVMSLGGQLFEEPSHKDLGTISEPDVLTTFEMWLDEPSESFGEGALKVGVNVGYGVVNSPFILATGRTIGGTEVTPQEKIDAFVDFVPGLLTGGLTKTGQVLKTTKKGLPGFNQFVKKAPDVTSTKGLPEGTKWQTRAGELFQQNKASQGGLETFDKARNVSNVGIKTKEEIEK